MKRAGMLRGNGLHAAWVGAVAVAMLAGCSVQPIPLTGEEDARRADENLEMLATNQPAPVEPLTLHGAMAHALLFNLDGRVQAMEQALALGVLAASRRSLLPKLSVSYGGTTRSNVQGSSSMALKCPVPIEPCPIPSRSLRPITSTDQARRTGNLTAVWHALDFGVSYYAARQQANRALIAHERHRKARQTTVAEVRAAWWRAVAAERALRKVGPLMDRVNAALADSARFAELRVRSPLDVLYYRRAMLQVLEVLETQRREGRRTKLELAELLGLGSPLGDEKARASYRIALPPEALPAPRQPRLDIEALEILALRHRPELREAQLSERIAAAEVKKSLLRVLPGIELTAGIHSDSNSFLVNQDWASAGAQISLNLTQLFTAPAAMASARAGEALERARHEALAMAVLTQLHVAIAGFQEAQALYATAVRIAKTQDAIVAQLQSGARLRVMDELEAVLAELEAVQTGLRRDLAFAEVEDGFGRVFAAAGADIATDGIPAQTPEALAAAIAATERAWMRGETWLLPYPARLDGVSD